MKMTFAQFHTLCQGNSLPSLGEVPDDVHAFLARHEILAPGSDIHAIIQEHAIERLYLNTVDPILAMFLKNTEGLVKPFGIDAELLSAGDGYVILSPEGVPIVTDVDAHSADWVHELNKTGSAAIALGKFYRCFLSQLHVYDVFFDVWGPAFCGHEAYKLRTEIEQYAASRDDNVYSIFFDPTHRFWSERRVPQANTQQDDGWAQALPGVTAQVITGGDPILTTFFTKVSHMDSVTISAGDAGGLLDILANLHPEVVLLKLIRSLF